MSRTIFLDTGPLGVAINSEEADGYGKGFCHNLIFAELPRRWRNGGLVK